MTPKSKDRMVLAAMIAVLVMGSGLRLYGLGIQSLWNDELESWRQSNYDTLPEVLESGVRPDTHPPAFQIILYLVEHRIGDREASLRLPSAVFGILSIAALLWVGRRVYGDAEALIAALLMATLWAPIFYSQEARNYAMAMLFVLLASGFWLETIDALNRRLPVRRTTAGGFAIFALASAYTHYFGLLVVALQALSMSVLSLRDRRGRGPVLASCAVFILGYIPWFPAMLEQFTHTDRISWIPTPKITAFPAFVSFAFNQSKPMAIVVLLLYLILFSRMIAGFIRNRGGRLRSLIASTDFLIAYWLVIPLTLAYTVSVLWTPILTQRNLIVSLPAAYLLLARAITQLPVRRVIQAGLVLAIAGLSMYRLLSVMGYYVYPYKEQYREAVQFVVDQNPSYPDSAIIGYVRFADYLDYYFARLGSDRRLDLVAGETGDLERAQSFLNARSPGHVWFIAAHRQPDTAFVEYMQRAYSPVLEKSLLGAHVWLFRDDDHGPAPGTSEP